MIYNIHCKKTITIKKRGISMTNDVVRYGAVGAVDQQHTHTCNARCQLSTALRVGRSRHRSARVRLGDIRDAGQHDVTKLGEGRAVHDRGQQRRDLDRNVRRLDAFACSR